MTAHVLRLLSRAQQCCGNCNAWVADSRASQANGPRVGACVAGPPVLIQGMAMVPGSQLAPQGPRAQPVWQGAWPPTDETKWCRAWQSMESEDEQSRAAN